MTKTLQLDDEYRRLDQKLDDLADKIIEAGGETAALEQLASSVETQLGGVTHLRDEYGDTAIVKIKGLTAGEIAKLEDDLVGVKEALGQDAAPGARMNRFVALGLVDAPFLDGNEDYDERLTTVADQPIGVVRWLRGRINDETTVAGGNSKGLDERLAERSES